MTKRSGQSLAEILVAVAIGALVIGSAVIAIMLTTRSNMQNRAAQTAASLAQGLLDDTRSVFEGKWHKIYEVASKGPASQYYLIAPINLNGTVAVFIGLTQVDGTSTQFLSQLSVGDYIKIGSEVFKIAAINADQGINALQLDSAYQGASASGLTAQREFSVRSGTGAAIVQDNITYTRWFSIEDVLRDNCGRGAITTATSTGSCGGAADVLEDPSTQKVVTHVTWPQTSGTGEVTVAEFMTRSKSEITRFTDWSSGSNPSPDAPVTQPDSYYVSQSSLNTTSTPGEVKLAP